jgi:L-ribulokinase
MQLYTDVTRRPLSLLAPAQGPALGGAIHAAVAAGAYPNVHAASAAIGRRQRAAYTPDETRAAACDALCAEYSTLHDHFGRGGNDGMHRLRDTKRKAISS